MHRAPLLHSLADYSSRHPDEAEVTRRFLSFVSDHQDCLERSLLMGHLTGSAWIVNARGDATLLTHHRKLDIWVQPGGHADGEPDLLKVALKEAVEETGLQPLEPVDHRIFDLDIHLIPDRGNVPAHYHYDVRFALQHNGDGVFTVSEESHDLAWVSLDQLSDYTKEVSLHRMAEKWLRRTK